MKSHASGQVYIWQGGSLWIGRSHGTTDTHAHHAIQISLALDGTFRLKTPGDPAWPTYTAALVPSHQPHALSTSSAVTATTFVEPEAYEGRILLERYGGSGVVPLPEALAAEAIGVLKTAYAQGLHEERLVGAAREAVRLLTAGARPRVVVDPRIEQAIALVRARIGGPVSQEEVAAAVFLSPSRFRHLFVEETGMAFRPYVLWLRLHKALECYTAGETLTSAAHAAGFSDLAHLSRTFRRMFGITPAALEGGDVFRFAPRSE